MNVFTVTGGDAQTEKITAAVADYFSLTGRVEAELIYCSPDEIREINARTRGVDSVTDVLSFPALELTAGQYVAFTSAHFVSDVNPENGNVILGSIVICKEVAERQAQEYGHSVTREYAYLFLHGILHLLGYDHMNEEDKTKMRKAEEDILQSVGIGREI